MTESGKVFDAFRNCITEPKCRDCPWTECDTLKNRVVEIPIDLALAVMRMLKVQEPRLVEPNDFENADDFNWLPAWCEERTGNGYWEMILPDALDEKDVRYWTGRPTDEQSEKEPWNGQAE